MTNRGLWIDDPVKTVLTPAYWDKLVDHRISTAAIMVERSTEGFDAIYGEDTLKKLSDLAKPRHIEVVLTIWPEPDKKYLAEMEAKVPAMLKAAGAVALEFDAEGNWLPNKVDGFPNIDKAGDALVESLTKVQSMIDVRTELTTYPFHTENNRSADVAPHVDRVLPQAYSVYKRKEKGVDVPQDWSGNFGPGKMQKLTFDKTKLIRGVGTTSGPLISCGLAAYDQVWPGHTGEEAMKVAYNEALKYSPVEIRFWSSKWVLGIMANGYASRFLKSL